RSISRMSIRVRTPAAEQNCSHSMMRHRRLIVYESRTRGVRGPGLIAYGICREQYASTRSQNGARTGKKSTTAFPVSLTYSVLCFSDLRSLHVHVHDTRYLCSMSFCIAALMACLLRCGRAFWAAVVVRIPLGSDARMRSCCVVGPFGIMVNKPPIRSRVCVMA